MFGAAVYGAQYFGQGPGEAPPFFGPVSEELEGANGPPQTLEGSSQLPVGHSGSGGASVSYVTLEGARE